ncbi:MAG TPA: hypothetical protein VHP83_00075, partial [Aggregatilineaceae bacterium]|nr:hypothetical protein [Aggregatilineaceae bacterium]
EEAESDRWLTVFVDRIDIYSTLHFRETYSLPWSNQYTISTQRRSRTIRWWDNDTLIYESITQGRTGGGSFWPDSTFLIDPFTGDTSSWLSGLDPLDYLLYPSPDWERAVYNANEEPFEAWGLYSFEGELLTDLPWIRGDVQWNSDSSRFVTLIQQEDGERQIVLLNREGEITDTVFIPENYAPLYGWSWDNRYIAFTQEVRSADPYNVQHFLYLIDTQEKYIIDTCFDINRDAAWSPDGMQLALTGRGANYPIYIYDLELRGIYPVAEHSGDIIGWRAD